FLTTLGRRKCKNHEGRNKSAAQNCYDNLQVLLSVNGMKFPRFRSLIWVGLYTAACLIVVACNKTGASKKPSPEAALPTRLDWNFKTLVDAYQKAGHTNPKWDEPAKRALTELARSRSRCTESNEAWGLIISTN